MTTIRRVLIANRGEIAVRILRTCRDMGIGTVAVYSECDRNALHVRMADQAFAIGPDQAAESYLRIDKLIDVAARAGADAVHPGYGFLAENHAFAEACGLAGLTFIGPSPQAMRVMGSKTAAREIAAGAGVPVVPGSAAPVASDAGRAGGPELAAAAEAVGYPLLVKAVAGGGGKGMRAVDDPANLAAAVSMARSEAKAAFGDDRIYFERRLEQPRHIEVQLLGDEHGTVVPFVERECSIQRRHQKLIEETPSPSVRPALRAMLMAAAADIGRAAGYTSAGTIEFLVDGAGKFYFLEMNTRLQVEHPITEAVTGVDFVRAQIEIAQGATMETVLAGAVGVVGHAIEVRVYAENPDEGFLPSPGLITHLNAPSGPGIRDDSGAFAGWTVPTAYDPLVSKVIAWAPDRQQAIARMRRALSEYDLRGISTTVAFCRRLIESPEFAAGTFDTTSVDRLLEQTAPRFDAQDDQIEEVAAIAAAMFDMAKKGTGVFFAGDRRKQTGSHFSLWAERARLEGLR